MLNTIHLANEQRICSIWRKTPKLNIMCRVKRLPPLLLVEIMHYFLIKWLNVYRLLAFPIPFRLPSVESEFWICLYCCQNTTKTLEFLNVVHRMGSTPTSQLVFFVESRRHEGTSVLGGLHVCLKIKEAESKCVTRPVSASRKALWWILIGAYGDWTMWKMTFSHFHREMLQVVLKRTLSIFCMSRKVTGDIIWRN